jgi:hypothetical protein
MTPKSTCGIWCWGIYALPCLGLLGWIASGHSVGPNIGLVAWMYGFPSTALLLPLVLPFWHGAGGSEAMLTCWIAGVANGGLVGGVVYLVRTAAVRTEPLSPLDTPSRE